MALVGVGGGGGGGGVPPGDPGGLRAAASRCVAAAQELDAREQEVRAAAQVPGWSGTAATTYTTLVHSACTGYVDQSSDALRAAAAAANVLANRLEAAQEKARSALARIADAEASLASLQAAQSSSSGSPGEASASHSAMLGAEIADLSAQIAALQAEVAEANAEAQAAATQAAGEFADVAAMTPSVVARRTNALIAAVRGGDVSGLRNLEDLDYLSAAAQETLGRELARQIQESLHGEGDLGSFNALVGALAPHQRDDELSVAFYNELGGAETSALLRNVAFISDANQGFDDPELLALVAPLTVMLGVATQSSSLRSDFTDEFLQRDVDDFHVRDHLVMGNFLLAAGSGTRFGGAFLAEAAHDLVVAQDPSDMSGNNPYIAPPTRVLDLVASNPEAAGLLLTRRNEYGGTDVADLLLRDMYWPDEGRALGAVIESGAHDLRYTDRDLANDVAREVIVTVAHERMGDHVPEGVFPALTVILDDHIVDFEQVAWERATGLTGGDVETEIDLAYNDAHGYVKVLFGNESVSGETARIIGERVGDDLYTAASRDDTEHAQRAGALSEMGVLALNEANLDEARAQDARDEFGQAVVGEVAGLVIRKNIPGLNTVVGMVAEELFPAGHAETALEDQGERQIDSLQHMRGLAITVKVANGDLPEEALAMVEHDGSVTADLNRDGDDTDALWWDLDDDGAAERVTERDLYDRSGHELSGAAQDAMHSLADARYAETHRPELADLPLPEDLRAGEGRDRDVSTWEWLWDGGRDEGVVDEDSGYVISSDDDLVWDPDERVYRLTLHHGDGTEVLVFGRDDGSWRRLEQRDGRWVAAG